MLFFLQFSVLNAPGLVQTLDVISKIPQGYVLNVLDARPAANISLRTVEAESIKVLKVPEMVQIDQIDRLHAIWEVYEGAIFMHQGETYLIRSLDLFSMTAHAQLVSVDYFTRSRDRKGGSRCAKS